MAGATNASRAASLLEPRTLDDLLLYRLHAIQARGTAMVRKLCEGQWGITHREWRVLAILARHGTLGPSALAEHAQLDRPRTSRAIASLHAKRLLARSQRPGDGRLADVMLTLAGRELYDVIFPSVRRINLAMLQALEPHEVAELHTILDRLSAQCQHLTETTPLPQADRRGGGSRRIMVD